MKHKERQPSGGFPGSLYFKERRKAYYHGKYHKRMFSLLLILTGLALIIARQGI